MSWIYKGASADTVAKAGALFQKALDLDPANIDALTGLAMVNFNVAAWGGTDDSAAYFATAEATASRALSLAPDNAFTHVILGLVLGFTKDGRMRLDPRSMRAWLSTSGSRLSDSVSRPRAITRFI